MENNLHIKPLLEYRVKFADHEDVFTADTHSVADYRIMFYRTGNLIREYFEHPISIVVTPVDPAEVPE